MTLDEFNEGSSPDIASSQALYRLLFQNSLDDLMLTAPDGSILEANPAACRIMGRTRAEIEGHQGLIDVSDLRLAALVAERQRRGGRTENCERGGKTALSSRLKSRR